MQYLLFASLLVKYVRMYLVPCVKEHNIICSKVILGQFSRNLVNLKRMRLEGDQVLQRKPPKFASCYVTSGNPFLEALALPLGNEVSGLWGPKHQPTLVMQPGPLRFWDIWGVKTYIWSVLNYDCETWTFKQSIIKTLQSFELWCYEELWQYHVWTA